MTAPSTCSLCGQERSSLQPLKSKKRWLAAPEYAQLPLPIWACTVCRKRKKKAALVEALRQSGDVQPGKRVRREPVPSDAVADEESAERAKKQIGWDKERAKLVRERDRTQKELQRQKVELDRANAEIARLREELQVAREPPDLPESVSSDGAAVSPEQLAAFDRMLVATGQKMKEMKKELNTLRTAVKQKDSDIARCRSSSTVPKRGTRRRRPTPTALEPRCRCCRSS
eukprot:TRINITY_DN1276_c0_g1_i3.p1 TRINITY_DN1276_c0_g1~~TRINITY_DN1276_c0_g1_i3.p1  ORF type:complete len:229 (-),score=39.21 TRINITY_DN1276_c0_g1_i3:292-978(-)